jgi:hypothetical protein
LNRVAMLASVGTATSPATDASSRAARLPGILLECHNRSLQRLVHPACTAERLRPAHLTPPIPAPVPDRRRWRCRRHWQHPPPGRVSRVGSCNRLSELGPTRTQSLPCCLQPSRTPSFQNELKREFDRGSLQWGTGGAEGNDHLLHTGASGGSPLRPTPRASVIRTAGGGR